MILIAIAVASMIFGSLAPEAEHGQKVMTGIASFPFLVGLVYCIFWFLFGRKAG